MVRWKDKETLERLYCHEGLSLEECADELGCVKQTVANWLERHDIERRGVAHHAKLSPAYHGWDTRGYERVKSRQTEVRVHRLVAIADGADPYRVFSGANVHHKNGVPWDNRPCNLEVLGTGEHQEVHAGTVNAPWKNKALLRYKYHNEGCSTHKIAREFGVSAQAIRYWMDKYGIERRDAGYILREGERDDGGRVK